MTTPGAEDDVVERLRSLKVKTHLENDALAEIERLRAGLSILANPNNYAGSGAIPIKASDFARALLQGDKKE